MSRSESQARGIRLGLAILVIVTTSMVAIGRRADQPDDNSGTVRRLVTVSPSTSTPLTDVAIVISGHAISFGQVDNEIKIMLEEDPSRTRQSACAEAIDYIIDHYLTSADRKKMTPTVNEVTVAAAMAAGSTMRASIPNIDDLEATAGTPDLEFMAEIVGTVLAKDEHERHMQAAYSTPGPDEIASAAEAATYGVLTLSHIPFSTREEGRALMKELAAEWGNGEDAMGFSNSFLDRVMSARDLTAIEEAMETFIIKHDMSEYPDYVRDALDRGHGTGGFAEFYREDGSGVVYYINAIHASEQAGLEETARSELEDEKRSQAQESYVAGLRAEADIEVNVDCDTY